VDLQQRIADMVAAGACMQRLGEITAIYYVGGVHWVTPGQFFRWCCMFPDDQHDIHFVDFDTASDNGVSILFSRDGENIACMAPADDFNIDLGTFTQAKAQWSQLLKDPDKRAEFEDFLQLA